MSVAVLKDLCEERNIKKIAMVDDVFDVPAPNRLDRVRYSEFRQRYNSDRNLRQAVAWVSGMTPVVPLPRFDDLDEEELEILWKSTWKPQLGGRKLRANHAQALQDLFQEHDDDVLGMLKMVVELLSLFRDSLERSVTVHGTETDYDADKIAKAEIVVIDYFLGHNLTKEQTLEKVSEVVTEVVKAARSANRAVPSFLLVSSQPKKDIEIEAFRERAKLMKSRFRYFHKAEMRADRIGDMVNLHDLIDASNHTEKVEQLIEDWQKGASEAISAVLKRILTLDISDLVYLDCFRLTHEGTSISNYLRWFLTASLNAKVTGKLTKKLWHEANDLKLFSVVDEGGHLDPKTLAKTFDGPSDEIAHAYGDILFDETRGTGDCAFPARLAGHDLVEGDLFVRPKGRDREGYEGAEVRLVITPSCDLLRRASDQTPSAQSVLLLPGILKRVIQEDKKNNLAEVDFVRVQERGEWCVLQIVWNFHQPISIDWRIMHDEGPGKAFKRLGRVRDLYFHRLRDEFANRFTRIGTEVAPLFPHPRSGKVFIAVVNGSKKFEPVMCFSSADGFVWEIGPVRMKGKSREMYVYQASRQFVDKLSEVLDHLPKEKPELKESAERSAGQLKDMQTYMELVRPMAPGRRGEEGVVEFKKATKRSDVKLRSSADLLIVTFID